MSGITEPIERLSNWVSKSRKAKGVYLFHEGSMDDRVRLSTKGAHICEIARLGLPVPAGLILSTDISLQYKKEGKHLSETLFQTVIDSVMDMEKSTGRHFGGTDAIPLILCVRSGALVSESEQSHTSIGVPESWKVPGVMTSLLGIGMNDVVVEHLSTYWSKKAALKSYAHFLMTFGVNIMNGSTKQYDDIVQDVALLSTSNRSGTSTTEKEEVETDWSEKDLMEIIIRFKKLQEVPQNVWKQLKFALAKVYQHWFADSSTHYRDGLDMYRGSGVAIILHEQVLGGSGVCSTRNPITGEHGLTGCYWPDGSGSKLNMQQFGALYPENYHLLMDCQFSLEKRFKDMQDVEFAIDFHGSLWILSCVEGHRRPMAAIKIAAAMVKEGFLTERKALLKVDPNMLDNLYSDRYMLSDGDYSDMLVGSGTAASDGVIVGKLAFNSQDVFKLRSETQTSNHQPEARIVFVTEDCTASDISCIRHCCAVVTLKGSSTSATSIFCRGLNKICIAGVSGCQLTYIGNEMSLCSTNGVLSCGDSITVNGATGMIYRGELPLLKLPQDDSLSKIKLWADKYRDTHVLGNIKSLADCDMANECLCDGYGMMDSIYLFSHSDMSTLVSMLLLDDSAASRHDHSHKLQKLQLVEMKKLLSTVLANRGTDRRLPFLIQLVTNRLLELLPQDEDAISDIANKLGMSLSLVRSRLAEIWRCKPSGVSVNPLMCNSLSSILRNLVTIQSKTILKATMHMNKQVTCADQNIVPCICLPAVAICSQASALIRLINETAVEVMRDEGSPVEYTLGLSIVTPQSCEKIDMFLAANPSITVVVVQSDVLSTLYYGVTKEEFEVINETAWTRMECDPEEDNSSRHIRALNNPFLHVEPSGILPLINHVCNICHGPRHTHTDAGGVPTAWTTPHHQRSASEKSGGGSTISSPAGFSTVSSASSAAQKSGCTPELLEKWKKQGITVGVCSEYHVKDPRTILALHDCKVNFLITPPDSIPVTVIAAAQATIKSQERDTSLGYLFTHPANIPHQLYDTLSSSSNHQPQSCWNTPAAKALRADQYNTPKPMSPSQSSSPYVCGLGLGQSPSFHNIPVVRRWFEDTGINRDSDVTGGTTRPEDTWMNV